MDAFEQQLLADVTSRSEQEIAKLVELAEDEQSWEVFETRENYICARRSTELGIHMFKGVGIINHPTATIIDYIYDWRSRLVWDKTCVDIRLVRNLGDVKVLYAQFQA